MDQYAGWAVIILMSVSAMLVVHRKRNSLISRLLPRFLGGASKAEPKVEVEEKNEEPPTDHPAPQPVHESPNQYPEHSDTIGGPVAQEIPVAQRGAPSDTSDPMKEPFSTTPSQEFVAEYDHHHERQDEDCASVGEAYDAAQDVRTSRYAKFLREDADDYTDGPCRYVLFHDGVKDCVALVMPYIASAKIQAAAKEQRDFTKTETQFKERLNEIRRFQSTLRREIRMHKFKIGRNADEQANDEATDTLKAELEVLEQMSHKFCSETTSLETSLRSLSGYLLEAYSELMVYLDEACVAAELIDPPSEEALPVQRLELQEQYQKFCAERDKEDGHSDTAPRPPIDTSRDFGQLQPTPPTAEQQAAAALRYAAYDAVARLKSARQEFELREQHQEMEKDFNRNAWLNGTTPVDVDTTAFDARWFRLHQERTRELIDAEEAVRSARKAARDGGLDVLSIAPSIYPSEGFASHIADGKCWSGSALSEMNTPRVVSTSARPKVLEWLGLVLDEEVLDPEQELGQSPEVEEWAAKEVETWDSASALETRPTMRRLIDKWQSTANAYISNTT